jgi:hypothetical protein
MRMHQNLPAGPFVERLLDEVLAWPGKGGNPAQADDITVVVIDIIRE